ncbi:trypsin-like serine protease [Sinomonas sp. ASV486]|uniref:S1 family peptidase n=1 Tax=Sinomonas sp. ASV486 TaxID=3051170 RepID=UPI0027DB6623|nr:trypsin-like serine protease [Sinomonas sp. ASV486]MDQ4491791.1 trypsin-like serine protease [Sinomonas sp. ASV486]
MRTKLAAILAALTTVCSLAFIAAPAQASTGGTADGDAHPGVAMIAFYSPDGRFRCSAALVSPTVLLTAAHCTSDTVGKVLVDFRPVVAEAPPSGLPVAANPSAGYTAADLTGRITGTAQAHPDYSGFTDLRNWNDLGVVVLDEPVTDRPTYPIAAAGTLDAIRPGDLAQTVVTAVGYGTEVRKPDSGPQKPVPMSYPLIRRSVDMRFQKLDTQVFQTHANVNTPQDTGGTCFGDSGGPVFLDGVIVGVTSFGRTANCRGTDGYQRVDIPSSQTWLAGFGVTP